MRDYALHNAAAFDEAAGMSMITRLIRNWRARRSVSRLEAYDDYMLSDIGVSRDDVIWAAGLPLTVNAALALEERSSKRRRFPSRD
jgi:uncharacterized protein YjiS (DUF1127 family)